MSFKTATEIIARMNEETACVSREKLLNLIERSDDVEDRLAAVLNILENIDGMDNGADIEKAILILKGRKKKPA